MPLLKEAGLPDGVVNIVPSANSGTVVAAMLEDLRWLGFVWEEPVIAQSQRLPVYRAALARLYSSGLIFPCSRTRRDVLEAITGEFGTTSDEDAWAVQREDGTWLFDGLIPVPELKDRLELKDLPEDLRTQIGRIDGPYGALLRSAPQPVPSVTQ